jgi:diacylglycerol kinase family enzyme
VNFRVTKSADDLAAQARAGLAAGYTRILALGGDGTFQQPANAIGVGQNVVLGVLPAGGGNDLARALGLGIPSLQQNSCSTARFVFLTLPGCGLPAETSGSTWVAEESASTQWPRNLPKEFTAIVEGVLVTCCR